MGMEDKIKEIQDEIRKTPYNKATQHHIGRLKAKLARLKDELQKRSTSSKSLKGYGVKKTGDATCVLVGFPSVGKSTLLNKLTKATSEVADYDFTTVEVIPGIMEYKGAKIQILDIPGLISGASIGKGRGKEALSVVRNADLILILIDVFNLEQLKIIKKELYDAGIRLNEGPPKVKIQRNSRGGIEITSTVNSTHLNKDTMKTILKVYKMHNVEVILRENITLERFIDALLGNRVYVPSLIALNKIDLINEGDLKEVESKFPDLLPISAVKGANLKALKEEIFKKLDIIRIYMKPHGREADLKEPLILKREATVKDVCSHVHKDMRRRFKHANVWGSSVKFDGQRVGLNHILKDGDIVSIVVKKQYTVDFH